MSAGYFATHGPYLYRAGFEPIPLNGKRPFLKHWEDTVLSADQLGFWVEKYGACNVGIRTAGSGDPVPERVPGKEALSVGTWVHGRAAVKMYKVYLNRENDL